MAYNRRNFLIRVIEIQNIVLEEKKKGVSQIWIYENIIYPQFKISNSTFNNYLGIPARKELKKLNKRKIDL